MSDGAPLPEEALDRWLADQYQALVHDLTAALDLEAGLREAMIPARHADLVADLRDVLDVEAGLSAIVPATPDAAFEADSEPWRVEESASPPGAVAVALRRGSSARVFVSYASEDRALAGELYRRLVADGHEVSLDQDRRDGSNGGEEWEQRLYERLRWADAMVCVVTSAYLASRMAEVGFARSQRSWLLPVWAEPGVDDPLLRSSTVTDTGLAPDSVGAALVKTLRRIDDAGGLSWPKDRSPFPGLRPFDTDQHQVFFGRADEVKQLAGLLRSAAKRAENAALLVVGPSGCGKSSLVRAGLLALMTYEPGWWTLPAIVPGADPVAALAHALATAGQHLGLDWTADQVRHQLDRGGLEEPADELLLAAPGGPQRRLLLLVVDQFEELLTQTGPTDRARFAGLLSGPVQVVATLRPEFLDQLLGDSALATLATTIYPLRPLRREALREVIEGPARLAGIGVDDDLVARLIADTDSGEALPLLAFTLAQLADGVGSGGQLSAARYDQLGGVRGALTRQADAALADATAATGRSREEVIVGLLRLVTVDEQGRPTRWRVPRDELSEPVTRELDVFVGRRLLTADTDNGSVVVGVAHEAFLSAWTPLVQAIRGNVSALRARRAVEQAATEWHDTGRPLARLWEGGQLAAAVADTGAHFHTRRVLVTNHVDLSPTAREFLRASIRRDRLRRRRATAVLSVLLVLAVVAAGFAVVAQRAAQQQRDVALSRQVAGQATELRATNPALAAQLGLAAYRLVPTTEARSSLLSTVANLDATRLTGHTDTVRSVAFSPDGRTLATASFDRTVRLWDVRDPHHPSPLGTLTGYATPVASAAFSPDGRTLVTASADQTVRLWDVRDPHHPYALGILPGYTSFVNSVAFSPDGHTLATASGDFTVRLWNVTDPAHPTPLGPPLTGHTSYVNSVAFSPDGHTLATTSADKTIRLWNVTDPAHPTPLGPPLTGHTSWVDSVAFSPDGRTLATASDDNTARLWDISDPHQPRPLGTLTGHTNAVFSVAFSPDGHTLATAGNDNTVILWDVIDAHQPHPLRTLTGHTNAVLSVAFSPDGRTLATASADKTVTLWDLPGPVLAGHSSGVMGMKFSPDGRTLATASADKTARLWDVRDPRRPSALGILTGHTNTVCSVDFSPNGHILATASADNTARLWDISNPHQPHPLSTLTGHTGTVCSVAFSPDGHTLATASADNTARLWDVSDPRRPSALGILTGDTNDVRSVAFSPDGRILATASDDTTARLWDVRDPRQPGLLGTLTGYTNTVSSVMFSPDGRTLATASADNTARLWDISDPHQPRPLGTLTGHTNTVRSVAFSLDGRTLATASADNTARLWDISDPHQPRPLGTLTGHTNGVRSVAFSPDGHTLATASDDTTARLWETNVDRVAARICSITPAITNSEWDQYLPDLPYQPPCP